MNENQTKVLQDTLKQLEVAGDMGLLSCAEQADALRAALAVVEQAKVMIRVKGRYNTEQATIKLAQLLGIELKAYQSAPEPAFYVSVAALEDLKDPRIAGKGCMLHKDRREGTVPVFTESLSGKDVVAVILACIASHEAEAAKYEGSSSGSEAREWYSSRIDLLREVLFSAGVPDGLPTSDEFIKVTAAGIHFGDCWYSHEHITGRTAEQLNNDVAGLASRNYMDWLSKAMAGAESGVQVAVNAASSKQSPRLPRGWRIEETLLKGQPAPVISKHEAGERLIIGSAMLPLNDESTINDELLQMLVSDYLRESSGVAVACPVCGGDATGHEETIERTVIAPLGMTVSEWLSDEGR